MMEEKEERLAHGRVPQRDEVHAGNIAELLGEGWWLVGQLGDDCPGTDQQEERLRKCGKRHWTW